jgi:hypothetical protein
MNDRDLALPDAGRRRLLQLALGTASSALAAGARAAPADVAPPRVTFMTREAGAAALAHAPGDRYYATLGLMEIRARLQSPLAGMSLADARVAVAEADAAAVLSFTDEECIAIRGVIARMQPLLAARAPLYVRTPWSFIKLDDRAEGGMPHTRGPHIVLPKSVADAMAKMHREMAEAGKLAVTPRGRNLLIHEQTHVLERLDPARFEPLFTDVFGFARMAPAPANAWLSAHRCTNPDGPDVEWALPLEKIGGSGWVMPDVILRDVPVPRMPQDFLAVGIDVAKTANGWQVIEEGGEPKRRDLGRIPGYDVHFPFPEEDFHPDEIAAVTLAHWILRDVPDLDAKPLMPGVDAWAKKALA